MNGRITGVIGVAGFFLVDLIRCSIGVLVVLVVVVMRIRGRI